MKKSTMSARLISERAFLRFVPECSEKRIVGLVPAFDFRRIKRHTAMTKIWIALVLMVSLLLCKLDMSVHAEKNIFAFNVEKAYRVLYLENGDILFAMRGDNRKVQTIECIDRAGTQLWTCLLPSDISLGYVWLAQVAEGMFAFVGNAEDGFYHVILADRNGDIRNDFKLPEGASSPVIVSTGVFFTSESPHGTVINAIDWDGQIKKQAMVPNKVISFYQGKMDANGSVTFAIRQSEEGRLSEGFINLDDSGLVKWSYILDESSQCFIFDWVNNEHNGITFAAQYMDESGSDALFVICLNGEGETVWRRKIVHDQVTFPTIQLMERSENREYHLWGHARVNMTEYTSFVLILDTNGNLISNEFKAQWGDAQKYIDGTIYAVVRPDDNEAYIMPFTELETTLNSSFLVTSDE